MPKKAMDVENRSVTFSFEDGTDVVVKLDDMPEDIKEKLALHGISQKLGDSYAGAKAATEGTDIDPNDWAKQQVEQGKAQLESGDWTVRTGAGSPGITDLARALAEVGGVTEERAAEIVKESDKEEKKQLRAHPDIAAVLTRLKAERAQQKAEQAASKAGSGPDLSDFINR